MDSNTGEVIQTMENVTNFLKSANAVGIPSEYIFSVSDLEETEGGGERPRVVDCLLCLKRMHEGQKLNGQYSTPSRSPFGAGPPYRRATASGFPASGLRATPGSEYGTPGEGFEPGVTPPFKMAAGKGVAAAVGVTRLMQQCTAMLRERMWTDGAGRPAPPVMQTPTPPRGAGATPESALEAMGPVLESVLGSLTQEYEKRLLAKVRPPDLGAIMGRPLSCIRVHLVESNKFFALIPRHNHYMSRTIVSIYVNALSQGQYLRVTINFRNMCVGFYACINQRPSSVT